MSIARISRSYLILWSWAWVFSLGHGGHHTIHSLLLCVEMKTPFPVTTMYVTPVSQSGRVEAGVKWPHWPHLWLLESHTSPNIPVCFPKDECLVVSRLEKGHRATVGVLDPWQMFQTHHKEALTSRHHLADMAPPTSLQMARGVGQK